MQDLISHYGYLALFLGTVLEGETALIIASVLARSGYLEFPLVLAVAFCGTLAGDQFFFYLGRLKGYRAIQKWPRWRRKAARVFELLHRHHIPVIIGFRFLYGLRGITPFVIGASGLAPARFLACNIVGATVWAVLIGTPGYLFGQAMETIWDEVKSFERLAMAGLAGVVLLAGLTCWLGHMRHRPRSSEKPALPGKI